MPGILPMKVIKVGSSAQSRIAQACDRCRSKKIRCDGVTPCCSQCANVGFECKTSDKLSRRAFPRGYTESLEERVRALEGEVRELKDLLDEKDEKIDMLSKIHSFSPPRRPSTTLSTASDGKSTEPPAKEDTFKIQQSPFLMENERNSDSFFMGASSGRAFVDAFKTKIQESGRSTSSFNTKSFFARSSPPIFSPNNSTAATSSRTPPRLLSDQMINVFFQEWAPLFPVLHRPTFLKVYEDYVIDPDMVKDLQSIAQIHLVFGIAALSTESGKEDVCNSEGQWQQALDSVISENTLATLQCLALAQIYCIAKGDYTKLLYYGGIAVTMSHRLGLHQSQKRFSLGALTRETRKKVFWTLYTLDCFSAALLGLPKLMKDDDIHTEYPADVDDENLTERGFQPALPGEATKLCSALALFRVSRIMSRVLSEVYPAATSHETSLQKIGALSDELDGWREDLAPHLRLQFVQDKPSTNVVSSRSPLLSLAYYYIRTLLHRSVASSDLGSKASSSIVALADSSKHIIQIVQLLEERHMSFSFCLNKNELLLLSGFGLLFQGLELKQEGKLIRDNQRLVCAIIEILERSAAPCASVFKKMACSMIAVERFAKSAHSNKPSPTTRKSPESAMPAPQETPKSKIKHLQAIASRFSFSNTRPSTKDLSLDPTPSNRRSTVPMVAPTNRSLYGRNNSQNSISSIQSEPALRASPSISHSHSLSLSHPRQTPLSTSTLAQQPNLDYLPFSNDPSPTRSPSSRPPTATKTLLSQQPDPSSDWERLLGYIDTSPTITSYDPHISPDLLSSYIDNSSSTASQGWSPDAWGIQDTGFAPNGGGNNNSNNNASRQSVFSLSEESLTSGEELSSVDFGGDYRAIMIPNVDDFGRLEGVEGAFGL